MARPKKTPPDTPAEEPSILPNQFPVGTLEVNAELQPPKKKGADPANNETWLIRVTSRSGESIATEISLEPGSIQVQLGAIRDTIVKEIGSGEIAQANTKNIERAAMRALDRLFQEQSRQGPSRRGRTW